MKVWAYTPGDGQMILLRAATRAVAVRHLNFMLKSGVDMEDTALTEIPKTWLARLESVREDAMYDMMAEEEGFRVASLEGAWGDCL